MRKPLPRFTTNESSPETLLQATALGDKDSFEQLFRLYYRRLGSFIRRLIAQPQAIEEIINDTMLAIWHGADRFGGRSKVDTWVFGIAYNKAMEHVRRHQRHGQHEVGMDSVDLADPRLAQASSTTEQELDQWVDQALGRLSPEHRAVVELTFRFGYSYPEIAQIMGCPAGTVKTRMFHARRQLKPVLERLAEPDQWRKQQ